MDSVTEESVSAFVHEVYGGEIKAVVRTDETIVFQVCGRWPPPAEGTTVVIRVNGNGRHSSSAGPNGRSPAILVGRISYPRIGKIDLDVGSQGVPDVKSFRSQQVTIRGKVITIIRDVPAEEVTDQC